MALTVAVPGTPNDAQRKLVAKLTRMKEQRQEICLQYLQFRLGADTQLKKGGPLFSAVRAVHTFPFRWFSLSEHTCPLESVADVMNACSWRTQIVCSDMYATLSDGWCPMWWPRRKQAPTVLQSSRTMQKLQQSFAKVFTSCSCVKKLQQIENRQLFHLHLARQVLNSSDLPLQETKKDLVFDVLAWRGMTGMISEGQLMDLMDKQQGRVPPNGWRDPAQALETQQIPGLNLCSLTAFGQLMQWSSF